MTAGERNSGFRAVVYDRYPLFLDVLVRLLRAREFKVLGATTAPSQALDLLVEHDADLLVAGLDGERQGTDGIGLIRDATERNADLKVIVLSKDPADEHPVADVFAAGASAYVTNDATPEDIAVAIRQMFDHSIDLAADQALHESGAAAEDAGLTDREVEVLALAAEGYSNAEVARLLWVTPQTVKFHLSNVYRKLNVSNRTQASLWAQHVRLELPESSLAHAN